MPGGSPNAEGRSNLLHQHQAHCWCLSGPIKCLLIPREGVACLLITMLHSYTHSISGQEIDRRQAPAELLSSMACVAGSAVETIVAADGEKLANAQRKRQPQATLEPACMHDQGSHHEVL